MAYVKYVLIVGNEEADKRKKTVVSSQWRLQKIFVGEAEGGGAEAYYIQKENIGATAGHDYRSLE
jgi:hypothetical protein